MKQRIAFLYLNTGGGHIGPAKALSRELETSYHDTSEPVLCNGFGEDMRISRFFFEDGYSITSNYFEPGYVLFYRLTELPVSIKFGNYLVSVKGEKHLANFFREQKITKVVCLHEVLIIMARRAIDRVNSSIPFLTLVTDPFSAHALWFYEKNTELVVFSEKLRKEAISRYGCAPDKVHTFPFVLSKEYDRRYTEAEIKAARSRHSIPEGQKIILIAGGGEGLKSADRIVSCFLKRNRKDLLLVVCGKNKLLKRIVDTKVVRAGATNVVTFGFVNFMCDLLNIADCVITKGGASTVMEVLSVGKPVIFSTFIRGQELGNILYAVHNGSGWYIPEPEAILDQAARVLDNPELARKTKENSDRLGIRNGLSELVRFIHDFH
jgi:processive 1,2-diacylglycerol beta-glucosyltransferase/1,2-diacylglycerol 3-beta-galactosyltransferase